MQQQSGLVLTETETRAEPEPEPETQQRSAKRPRLEPASDDDDEVVIKRAQREAREKRAAEEAAETEAGTEAGTEAEAETDAVHKGREGSGEELSEMPAEIDYRHTMNELPSHAKKAHVHTRTHFMRTDFSDHSIRFSEDRQLIDVIDCFQAVYGNAASAKSQQNKMFAKKALPETKAMAGCGDDEVFISPVCWTDTNRTRPTISVQHMRALMKKKTVGTAQELAAILNVGRLTIKAGYRFEEAPTQERVTNKNATEKNGGAKRDASVRKDKMEQSERSVVIYMVIYIPEDRAVYIGKTVHEKTRLSAHGSRSSKCRLMRNALRKNGLKNYRLSPILRCKAADADANESEWIIKSNTLFPNGLNLRHGSKAGESADMDSAITPVCTSVIPFSGVADKAAAHAEAWSDIADMAEEFTQDTGDDTNNVDVVCKDLLKRVHPDRGGGDKSYTGVEVAAMLNSIREVL